MPTDKRISDEDRQFWAFCRIRPVTPPEVQHADRVRTPVDHFVLARLEKWGLLFSPDANRITLVRRACFDLTGLPPPPHEVTAFLADDSPDAYERLIDRLLSSSHFGERWGRHWLDEAGYSDTNGSDTEATTIFMGKDKWRYRDYVVGSMNADKTFDQFITQQLAGDELAEWRNAEVWTPEVQENLVATGFLSCATDDTDQEVLNKTDLQYDVLQRTGELIASNLLALTIDCSKCHDHKYEPLPQRDYYRLMSFFQPAYNPASWLQPVQRALPGLADAERKKIEQQSTDLQQQLAELRQPYQERVFDENLAMIPGTDALRSDTKKALLKAEETRGKIDAYLAKHFDGLLKGRPEQYQAHMEDETLKALDAKLSGQLAAVQNQIKSAGYIQAIYEVGPPPPTRLLYQGNEAEPREVIAPGFLAVLCDSEPDALLCEVEPQHGSSGRRLALARWLTDWKGRSGALVARVRVNRIWQRLFGEGIVSTSGNLGQTGRDPTHPDLIEWLAAEYIRNGRRYKPLIKLLMTSTVYRQASSSVPADRQRGERAELHEDGLRRRLAPPEADPDNRLLWRMRLRRLESEVVRDAMLFASGQLNHTLGGPPVMLKNHSDGSVSLDLERLPHSGAECRRSIYLLARRNYHLSILAAFDQPAMGMNCLERADSAVVTQSLAMLNDDFVIEQAEHLAKKMTQDAAVQSIEDQINNAFQLVLARPPRDQEVAWGRDLLEHLYQYYRSSDVPPENVPQQALAEFCNVLFNTNEFLYLQ